MPHVALMNQILDRSGHFLYRNGGIDAMLVEQVDHIRPKTPKRGLGYRLDALRSAVQPANLPGVRIDLESELCRDHHLFTEGSEGFSDEIFVGEWTVHLRCFMLSE